VKKPAKPRDAYTLGLDLGSRSVKAVLLDARLGGAAVVSVRDGTPDKAADAESLLRDILAGARISRADIQRVLATGYGRVQADFADETPSEIACHALGVRHFRPDARTVIDIGGQDSKVILLDENGEVRDFAMNDRCAAGCGRFLEVVARILGTDVGGLSGLAQGAEAETEISSMCVVFAESEVIGMLARGFPPAEIAAGIMRSIARRVAGLAKRVGLLPPVALTGGVALNQAMAAALGRELGESLAIPSDPRITGALGAAMLAARKAAKSRRPKAPRLARGAEEAKKAAPGTSPPPHRLRSVGRFDDMISYAVDYAEAEKARGRKIVSIFCEFTPRELVLAAGAVPVCACGGNYEMALAAERELPAALCPLIKSSYGFALEKASPFFEMSDLAVAETTCDGKKKMFELLGEGRPLHLLELPQKPQDEGAFRRWREEIEGLKRRLEELTGETVTEKKLRAAVRLMNRERRLRRAVARLAGRGLTGREVLSAKSVISGIPEDLEAYEKILAEAAALRPGADGRPAVLMTGVPMPHGAEKVLDIIEAAGATVVAQESCTGLKPLDEDVAEEGDLLEAVARKYFHLPCSCMTPNAGRFALLDRLIEEFKPQGVVDLVWQSCLTYDIESRVLKRHLERTHGLPYLKIVTDYSPSDAPQLRLRVEAFVGLLASRRR